MKVIRLGSPFLIFLIMPFTVMAKDASLLDVCCKKQASLKSGNALKLTCSESHQELTHGYRPWSTSQYHGRGTVWVNKTRFCKDDSITSERSGRTYHSQREIGLETMAIIDYGEKKQGAFDAKTQTELLFESARCSPVLLLNYCQTSPVKPTIITEEKLIVFNYQFKSSIIKLHIRTTDSLLEKITTVIPDEYLGDLRTDYSYGDIRIVAGLHVPWKIEIDRVNGKFKDECTIEACDMVDAIPELLEPAEPSEEKLTMPETLSHYQLSDKLHMIVFDQADIQTMLIEFNDFIVAIEAPLTPKNGEDLIQYAAEIIPNKPIRYFTFGHFHPHYTGGLRAMVHHGATILSHESDWSFVHDLTTWSHSLEPDSLETNKKSLKMEEIIGSREISDGNYTMQIHHIGGLSDHTEDYMVYYFPEERLVFEGDLIYIKKEGELKKAGGRQRGLYEALTKLNLDVETIVQSWPLKSYGMKTEVNFDELTRSVKMIEE